jgi:hypothetical protein
VTDGQIRRTTTLEDSLLQDETRVLRRQLFDKRPIIENKLLSGRQFLAAEPTPSDTSDSDSKFTEAVFVHLESGLLVGL